MPFAKFQQRLITVLCGVALATLFANHSVAQQISYPDFNTVQDSTLSQTSNSCTAASVASGVLFCFNFATAATTNPPYDLRFVQDTYPASIDPNGGTGSPNYALQLTANAGGEASSVWYSTPQDVADGFTVWYAAKLTPSTSSFSYTADGLAFVIQNAAGSTQADPITGCKETGSGLTALGSGGGCIGYGGIDNGIALEMDPYADTPFDPAQDIGYIYQDNHIALQGCGPGNQISYSHLSSSTSPNN